MLPLVLAKVNRSGRIVLIRGLVGDDQFIHDAHNAGYVAATFDWVGIQF